MGLAPGLYPQEIGRAVEVVPALGRGSPAALAGGLTGLAASRLGTVVLVPAVAWVRLVQLPAVAALTPSGGVILCPKSKHPCLAGRIAGPRRRPTGRRPAGEQPRIEEDDLLKGWKKTQPKKTATFKPADLPHFRNGVDMCQRRRENGLKQPV